MEKVLPLNCEKACNKVLLGLLADKASGGLTQEQLEDGCCYWAYDNALEEMRWSPYPQAPLALRQWRGLSEKQKHGLDENVLARLRAACKGYYEAYSHAKNSNATNQGYLKHMLKTFEKYGNVKRADDTRRRIKVFEEKI